MENSVMSYEEFKDRRKIPKYFGETCFVGACTKPSEYEGGDARFYCGMCEEHSGIKKRYDRYVAETTRRATIEKKWRRIVGKGNTYA